MLVRPLPLLALGIAIAVSAPDTVSAQDKDNPIIALVKKRVSDAKKPFTLVVALHLIEGAGEKFEALFAKAQKATRKEPGCITYDLNQDLENKTKFFVYERWKSM